jgi:hypothetical protein
MGQIVLDLSIMRVKREMRLGRRYLQVYSQVRSSDFIFLFVAGACKNQDSEEGITSDH